PKPEMNFVWVSSIATIDVKNENFFQIKKAWIKGIGKEEVENRFNVVLELSKNDLLKILNLEVQIFESSYLFVKNTAYFQMMP
ncbi:MAG: hypothetical protein QMD80_09630, partial [archaeon]|nr:hypothetical protein [archaeon]